jgi:hypothetical protein
VILGIITVMAQLTVSFCFFNNHISPTNYRILF